MPPGSMGLNDLWEWEKHKLPAQLDTRAQDDVDDEEDFFLEIERMRSSKSGAGLSGVRAMSQSAPNLDTTVKTKAGLAKSSKSNASHHNLLARSTSGK